MMRAFGESFVAPLKLSACVSGMTREFPTVFRNDPHRLSGEAGSAWGRATWPGHVSARTSAGGAGLQDPHGVPSLQSVVVVCSPALLCHIGLHNLLTRVCNFLVKMQRCLQISEDIISPLCWLIGSSGLQTGLCTHPQGWDLHMFNCNGV